MLKNNLSISTVLGGLLIGCIVLLFCLYNYYYAVDFPYMDDFMLIVFVQEYIEQPFQLIDFINKLFQSANSHKLVIPRLIALGDYFVNGYLNFKGYQLLVTVNILAILLLLYREFRKLSLSIWYFLPIVLWLLQPQYYDITLFGLNGMQHTSAILFSIISILFIQSSNKWALPVAILMCFLATFSHGNGFFSYTGIVFYLLVMRRYKQVGWTILSMIMSLAIFLYKTNDSNMARLPKSIGAFLESWFGFLGSFFFQSSTYGLYLAVLAGAVVTLYLLFKSCSVLLKGVEAKNGKPSEMFWLSFFVFIASTAFVIALLRSWTGPAIASRFQIYSPLILSVGYVVFLLNQPRIRYRKIALFSTTIAAILNVHSYYYYTDTVASRNTKFLADIYNWHYYKTMFTVGRDYIDYSAYFLEPAFANQLVLTTKPIISPQEIDQLMYENSTVETIKTTMSIHLNEDVNDFNPVRSFTISSATPLVNPDFATHRFLVAKAVNTGEYLLLSAMPQKASKKIFFTSQHYFSEGFQLFLREGNLLEDEYELFILDITTKGEKSLYRIENERIVVNQEGEIHKKQEELRVQ